MRTVFLLIAFAVTSITKGGVIRGKVVDALTRQPLEAAIVYSIDDPDIITLTDEQGDFYMNVTDTGIYLKISYIGYKAVAVSVTNKENISIGLQPDILKLEDVIIRNQHNHLRSLNILKADLELKPVKNAQELLRLVPGLFIAQHAGGGKAEQIFLRGFDIDHGTDISISVDDMPVNMVSHAHGQGYADAHFIIPETISNINFGVGPYTAGKGNLNIAGYVNYKTFRTIPKSRIQVEAGRFDTYRALIIADVLRKNKEKHSAYIAGEYHFTNGATNVPQRFNRINLFGRYNLSVSSRSAFSLSLSAFDSKWNASGQIPERSVSNGSITRYGSIDPTEGGNTQRYNAALSFNHSFGEQNNIETKAYLVKYRFDLFSNFTFFLNDPVNGDGIRQKENRSLAGFQSVLRSKYHFRSSFINSQYGTGFRYDDIKGSELSHQVQRRSLEYYRLGNIKEMNAFAFIQQQLATGKWIFDAAVRLDHFYFDHQNILQNEQLSTLSGSIISPKLGIQYNLSPSIQLYSKLGKGFHSNDARVSVIQKEMVLPAAYGSDMGINFMPSKKMLISVAMWYLYLEQEFVYVGDEGIVESAGRTIRKGIDMLLRWQVTDHIFTSVNLNFTDARLKDEAKGKDHIPLAPLMNSTGGIFYKAKKGLNGGMNYRYMKDRPADEENAIVAKGYFILDAVLNYTTEQFELGLAAENLFDTKWNEAQFATTSKLKDEPAPVTELHFTPGTPFAWKFKIAVWF